MYQINLICRTQQILTSKDQKYTTFIICKLRLDALTSQ